MIPINYLLCQTFTIHIVQYSLKKEGKNQKLQKATTNTASPLVIRLNQIKYYVCTDQINTTSPRKHYMDLLNNFFGIFKTIIEPLFKANV